MRIAIVNDMVMSIEALRRVVATVPDHQIVWVARNGAEAVEKCAADTPDLILMDLVMPVMDGVEATRQITAKSPCAILVVTSTVTGNISKVFDAMGCGALDAVCTPVLGTQGDMGGADALLAKIKTIGTLLQKAPTETTLIRARPGATSKRNVAPLVVIGASTGGPQALAELLAGLPEDYPAALVIVQHVDAVFTPGLADWLNQQSQLKVQLINAGMRPYSGKAWLACTNDHLIFNADLTFGYTAEPLKYPYRPSVDVFFESCARHVPGRHTAALLTGMGRDGAKGLLTLRNQDWVTIAQDKKSSIVYGMPKAAADLQAASEVLSLKAIGQRLASLHPIRRN